MFFEIVPQRVELGRTSTPVGSKKDTVLFRYFLASLCPGGEGVLHYKFIRGVRRNDFCYDPIPEI